MHLRRILVAVVLSAAAAALLPAAPASADAGVTMDLNWVGGHNSTLKACVTVTPAPGTGTFAVSLEVAGVGTDGWSTHHPYAGAPASTAAKSQTLCSPDFPTAGMKYGALHASATATGVPQGLLGAGAAHCDAYYYWLGAPLAPTYSRATC